MTGGSTRRSAGALPRTVVVALAAPAVVLLGGFYVWPLVALARRAVGASAISDVLGDESLRGVLWFTLWQASVSTAITVVVGLVPAYVLARYEFRGRRAMTVLTTVPFVLPTVVVGAAFAALLPDSLRQSATAVIVAHVFFNVAVVVRGVGGMWEQLPRDLLAAARTLGASPWRAAKEITLPLLAPAIAAAASVVFLFTFTSFGVVRILGGPAHPTLEVEIWQRATRFGEVGAAAVLSLAQLLVVGVAVLSFAHLQRRHRAALGLRPIDRRERVRTGRSRMLVLGTCVSIVTAVGVPLLALLERSMRASDGGRSLTAWRAVLGDDTGGRAGERPSTIRALDMPAAVVTSLRFMVIATVLSLVIGCTVALAIASMRRGGALLDTGVMLPLGTSAVTVGFGLLVAFSAPPLDWRAAPLMIPLGHALVATPFVVRLVLPTLRAIDPRLRDAATTLGASPVRAWREIDVRMIAAPLATAAGFAGAISLGEFGATAFLTRQGRVTLPIAIEQLLGRPGALPHAEAYALSTILAVLTVAVVGVFELGRGRRRG